MVGNDANADFLQLAEHITGTTEVGNILAQKPEWDQTPHHLCLPVVDKEGNHISLPNRADHVNPHSWLKEKLLLHTVNLLTSWKKGVTLLLSNKTVKCAIEESLKQLIVENPSGVNILHPLGKAIEPNPLDPDNVEEEDKTTNSPESMPNNRMLGGGFNQELEDVAAEEAGNDTAVSFKKFIVTGGKKVNKVKALAQQLKYRNSPSSTDRLKCVQNVLWYDSTSISSLLVLESGSGLLLMISDPIVSILTCEGQIFLSFGEVIQIELGTEVVEQAPITLLVEDGTMVTYQLLSLVSASVADDKSLTHDWKSK
uniref:Uncharacterized protein n=1 Tax=Moniliophthora roreri TaxID=221103 RepID=A0A0W0GDR5_MONRR